MKTGYHYVSATDSLRCELCDSLVPARDGKAIIGHIDSHREPLVGSVETRITDPVTGGQKGAKDAQLGAVDPEAVMEVARVAGFGSAKYERYNFMKGYKWSLSYDALQRHLHAFWGGEDRDPESGRYHLGHAAWHCLALLCFAIRGRGTDDRPFSEVKE